jgi:hypothetical protein
MISIKVIRKDDYTKFVAHGEKEVCMCVTSEYEEGDRIVLEYNGEPAQVWFMADDAIPETLLFIKGNYEVKVPFGEERKGYSAKAFRGNSHYLHARMAEEHEIYSYRNLALNPLDSHTNNTGFPHATANVETRNEAVFAARNAIDGVKANVSHGEWPYNSWGINRDPNAELKIDFGRDVVTDRIRIYLRADFPHDNWWKEIKLEFSDGSDMILNPVKTGEGQDFRFDEKTISSLVVKDLIKAEEESPFPALTQIEIYGTVKK